MTALQVYLNFDGKAEEAFLFYQSVFGGEFLSFQKMKDTPHGSQLPENEQNRLMHVSLQINNNCILMASDILPSAGHQLKEGNNYYISINAESEEEARLLFNALSKGGSVEMPLEEMFWGALFGSFEDKFSIRWMVNFDKNGK